MSLSTKSFQPVVRQARYALPVLAVRTPTSSRVVNKDRKSVVAAASSTPPANKPVDGLLKFSANIGLPTDEGLFGFGPFAEQWCGRLAMMGFLISMIEEFITGQGTLAQIGLMTPGEPSPVVLVLLCVVFGGATAYGTADTLNKIRNKKMSKKMMDRYKKFLLLKNEKQEIAQVAQAMKLQGDFTAPGNDMAAVEASKAAGSPADAFLSTNEVKEGEAAAQAMKAQQVAQAQRSEEILDGMLLSEAAELKYAQDVEMSNGRWAMLGFLAAILAEAATGNGIIVQCIQYLKWMNILGADSGF